MLMCVAAHFAKVHSAIGIEGLAMLFGGKFNQNEFVQWFRSTKFKATATPSHTTLLEHHLAFWGI